jgi:hypothetical protein
MAVRPTGNTAFRPVVMYLNWRQTCQGLTHDYQDSMHDYLDSTHDCKCYVRLVPAVRSTVNTFLTFWVFFQIIFRWRWR